MNTIKITAKLNADDPEEIRRGIEFLEFLEGKRGENVKQLKVEAEEVPAKRAKKQQPAKEQKEEAAAEEQESGAPTVEDVRVAMSTKIGKHRDAITDKMKSYKAKNLSSVPEDKRQEFLDYIESLD